MRAAPIVLSLVLSSAVVACARQASAPLGNVPTAAAQPPTASAPAHPCVGTWNEPASDSGLTFTAAAGSATCGHMEYASCRGEVEGCAWTADGVTARYRCVGEDETFTGTLAVTCTGDRATVVDDTDGHDVYTDAFVRL